MSERMNVKYLLSRLDSSIACISVEVRTYPTILDFKGRQACDDVRFIAIHPQA